MIKRIDKLPDLTPQEIMNYCFSFFNIHPIGKERRNRNHEVMGLHSIWQVMEYVLRKYKNLSFDAIGELTNSTKYSHAVVMNSVTEVQNTLDVNIEFRKRMEDLFNQLEKQDKNLFFLEQKLKNDFRESELFLYGYEQKVVNLQNCLINIRIRRNEYLSFGVDIIDVKTGNIIVGNPVNNY